MFDHLRKTDLSYFAHMKQALKYSMRLQQCAIKVFIHAFLPDKYTNDASSEICRLHEEMHSET